MWRAWGCWSRSRWTLADSIAKTADAIGIGTTALQEYRFALEISGVAQEKADQGIKKFTRNMGELAKSSSETQSTLKDLDPVLLNNLRSLNSVEDQLALGFRALASYTDQSKRAAVAAALFGRAGIDMSVGVSKGIVAFEGLRQKARDLGLVIREDLLRNAEDAQDQLTILGKVIGTNVTNAILEAAPQISDLARRFADAIPEIMGATAAFLEFIGVLDVARLERVKKLREEIATIETKFANRPFGAPTVGADFERLAKRKVELAQLLAEMRALSVPSPSSAQAPGATPTPETPGGGGFVPKAKDLDAAFAAKQRSLELDRQVEEAARRNLDTVFATIQTNEERYLAEIAFLEQTRAGLEQTGQLDAANLDIIERGKVAAKERLELDKENNPALLEKRAILASVATEEERLIVLQDKLAEAVSRGVISQEEMNEVLRRTKARTAGLIDEQQILTRGMDLIDSAIAGNITSWEDLGRVAIRTLQDILTNALRTQSALGGSGGGGLGGILSGVFGPILNIFGGGGAAAQVAGDLALVGEKGKELFRPDVAGTIIPNSELGGSGGGGGGQALEGATVYMDLRGAGEGVQREVIRAVRQLRMDTPKISVAAVQDARRRNPGLFR